MNLLLTGCFKYTDEQFQILKSLGYSVFFLQYEKEELPLPANEIDATVCNGLFLSHDIEIFSRLKFIQLTSAGYDRVPVEKIHERKIELYNAKGVYSIPMAEWVIYRVLEYYKQGCFFYNEQRKCQWTKHRGLREINNINVAIVGAGNVGSEVAKRFQAFGAKTTGFDIHTHETVGFNKMLPIKDLASSVGKFDVIVITAPLLPSTHRLINREIMLAMKNNAILINISRGGLIDESAMCDVLKERNDIFAALDVFETEPLSSDNPLWKLPNVAISPHNSFVSDGNNERMFEVMYNNLKNFINKGY